MSFSRVNYDSCAYDKKIAESTAPAEYMLYKPRNPESCFIGSPQLRYDRGAVSRFKDISVVDVDSELMGLNRSLKKCQESDLLRGDKEDLALCGSGDRFLYAEDTKISNPPCTLRGRGWNRWEWLCEDPQDKALRNFNVNMSDRSIAKDNHRPLIPKPLDATNSVSRDDGCYTDTPSEFYDERKEIPIMHWRSCEEIRNL